jgi:CubicO group peptidase (beta-lactamase class C family)
LDRIVPTEYDVYFRQQLIHGDVHDPGAAMLGGVGGHAGLFSNANDLAKLMQTFLNKGSYGGVNIFSDSVIEKYTECLYCEDPEVKNRRGIGFDKPVRDDDGGPTCQCVSYASFGHTGFTGTMAWADPEQDIVYVFLSNRIYPSAANKKLITMDIRTDIMQVIYDSIEY